MSQKMRRTLRGFGVLGAVSLCLFYAMPATAAVCGDSIPDIGEQCDDGNSAAGDGCSSSCQVEPGFSCTPAVDGTPPIPSVCNPASGQIQFDPASVFVDEDAGTATVTVTRTGGSFGEVSATYVTTDGTAEAGSDYTRILSTIVTFADGDTTSKSINVTIIDDSDPEVSEAFTVDLASPTGGASLGNASATVNINANDLNGPPSPPVINFPADGSLIIIGGMASDPFVPSWTASIDPENDSLFYTWQLYLNGVQLLSVPGLQTAQVELTMGTVRSLLTANGFEIGESATFSHRALVTDGVNSVEGPFSSVTLSLRNFQPSPPVILTPPDGSTVNIEGQASDPFVPSWTASIDPENDSLLYTWQLFSGGTQLLSVPGLETTQVELTLGAVRSLLTANGFARGDSATFTHRAVVADGINEVNGRFASVTLVLGNFLPIAEDDRFDATEDSLLTVPAPGVLDGDTDPDNDPLTAVAVTTTSNGTLDLSDDGSFTYDPIENYCGEDSFSYKANDGMADSNVATVSITVDCVNDPAEVTSVAPIAQTVDYSDNIATVTVEVTDVDDASTGLVESGEPAASASSLNLTATTPACVVDNTLSPNPDENGSVCTWTYSGQVLSPGDNVHDILFTPSDGAGEGISGLHELTIEPEDADVMLDGDNDVSAEVEAPGGDSGPFSLFFTAYETDDPDFSHGSSADFGDLNEMKPFMTLIPVGPGGPVDADSCDFLTPLPVYPGEGYEQQAYFQCNFDGVPVNTYEVVAAVDGATETMRYYAGSDDDVFTVFDPSLGFTTGGGWFYWPGTDDETLTACGAEGYPGDKTNFGFNLKYNKKKRTAKGSVLVIRHTVDENCLDAGSFRVKSNAIEGMSLGEGEDADGAYGWAAAAGKSVFREPGLEGEGNHAFLLYVEDHGQQGCNQDPVDEFWIEVRDKDEVVVLQLNGSEPAGADEAADGQDEPIVCGNIVVPHKAGKSGGGGSKKPNPNKPPRG
ncbi:MAG: cadherin-like domain-containing protein [Xanthomonadales bacterium]|nr:cadherin-like domain-containing protein [Xanthomonadales bacterium]